MAQRRARIAIVDDDRPFRKALQRLLTASGLDTETYASGAEFLEAWGVRRPDCLLLDMQMPSLSGLAVLRHLAKTEHPPPTIIITNVDEPETRAQCLAAGAVGFLCKPVAEVDLLELIVRATGAASLISPSRPNG
jgi:FixJ family two-component response regulator